MGRSLRTLLALTLLGGCSRDLTTPPPAPPGRISGRVVYAIPGRSDARPAGGAVVSLLGSGLSTTTNQAGTFSLSPLDDTTGLLLFAFDADGDGTIDRQKVEQLSDWKTGPHRQVQMGDVALGENASVHGRVLLANVMSHTGLGGSAIFVPEGPFAAYTADDGSFLLPNLPEGPLEFYVFHAGYEPKSLGTVTLRAGEDYSFRDAVLAVSTEPTVPGTLVGSLLFSPAQTAKGDSAVSIDVTGQPPVVGVVAEDLGFRFTAVPPGLYTLTASRTGYTRTRVPNVLVLPAKEASIGIVLLTNAPEPDAGQPPVEDAGTDGGKDAGTDGGVDGGPCGGAACSVCLSNAQCTSTQWCDQGFCAPQCTGASGCSNGRGCDSVTRTCVTLCGAGCAAGQVCEAASNICRVACDLAFPCAAGFKCDVQNRCVPECAVQADCASAFLSCVGGQCVPNGQCADDRDCSIDRLCLLGSCVARPTARIDGGSSPFVCANACQCRLGETCAAGLCLSEPTPTRFLKSDGGGDGTSIQTASSDLAGLLADAGQNTVLALRKGDVFGNELGFDVAEAKVTLAGGYEECSANRWVRGETGRTTLAADAGSVLRVVGSVALPLAAVRLRNLTLQPGTDSSCYDDLLTATDTIVLQVERIDGALRATNSCAGAGENALLNCTNCNQAAISNVTLRASPQRTNQVTVVRFATSNGTITAASADPQPGPHYSFTLVENTNQNGPVEVKGCSMPTITVIVNLYGIDNFSCLHQSVLVEGNNLAWGLSTSPNYGHFAVSLSSCYDATVRGNVIDGSAVNGTVNSSNHGVFLSASAGVLENNTIKLPRTSATSTIIGISSASSYGQTTIRNNQILGGLSHGDLYGVWLVTLGTGPTTLTGNTIDIGPTVSGIGVNANNVVPAAGLRLIDNFIRVTGDGICSGDVIGVELYNQSSALLERDRIFASGAQRSRAIDVFAATNTPIEVYSSHLFAGTSVCAGTSAAIQIYSANSIYLNGNTLDAEVDPAFTAISSGIQCDTGQVFGDANVFGGGNAPSHRAVREIPFAGTCYAQANFTRNYFWHSHPSTPMESGDFGLTLANALPGVIGPSGNLNAQNTSPFESAQPTLPDGGPLPRHRLAAGSLAVDRGGLPRRVDGSDVVLDLDRRPRDAGMSADLGCCERN